MFDVSEVGENYIMIRNKRIEIPKGIGSYFLAKAREDIIWAGNVFDKTYSEQEIEESIQDYAGSDIQMHIDAARASTDKEISDVLNKIFELTRREYEKFIERDEVEYLAHSRYSEDGNPTPIPEDVLARIKMTLPMFGSIKEGNFEWEY